MPFDHIEGTIDYGKHTRKPRPSKRKAHELGGDIADVHAASQPGVIVEDTSVAQRVCQTCRWKLRRKCDRRSPCNHCQKHGDECVPAAIVCEACYTSKQYCSRGLRCGRCTRLGIECTQRPTGGNQPQRPRKRSKKEVVGEGAVDAPYAADGTAHALAGLAVISTGNIDAVDGSAVPDGGDAGADGGVAGADGGTAGTDGGAVGADGGAARQVDGSISPVLTRPTRKRRKVIKGRAPSSSPADADEIENDTVDIRVEPKKRVRIRKSPVTLRPYGKGCVACRTHLRNCNYESPCFQCTKHGCACEYAAGPPTFAEYTKYLDDEDQPAIAIKRQHPRQTMSNIVCRRAVYLRALPLPMLVGESSEEFNTRTTDVYKAASGELPYCQLAGYHQVDLRALLSDYREDTTNAADDSGDSDDKFTPQSPAGLSLDPRLLGGSDKNLKVLEPGLKINKFLLYRRKSPPKQSDADYIKNFGVKVRPGGQCDIEDARLACLVAMSIGSPLTVPAVAISSIVSLGSMPSLIDHDPLVEEEPRKGVEVS